MRNQIRGLLAMNATDGTTMKLLEQENCTSFEICFRAVHCLRFYKQSNRKELIDPLLRQFDVTREIKTKLWQYQKTNQNSRVHTR